ncbi:hypothetical protein LAZ67_16001781 [Cordylochernes scorpioides]|uniref:RNA-directed DNA polymerase n=1 Tax=Cordylochernes scorpioides TaxID=51811 RepID=A0ABY6LCP1_9ARAC|nr:hypothetical protein LAZ67_16001781 [Cordylochernes scorpioides]
MEDAAAEVISLRPYRTPYAYQKEIQDQIAQLLKHDIITPSSSPYSSPVTLVRQRDNTMRLCIDFRRVNKLVPSDLHPLPLIENGTRFVIYSDHHALQWLKTIKDPTGRLFRWSLRLSAYDYDVKYLKGSGQYEADLLSRNPFCGFLSTGQIKDHQGELRRDARYILNDKDLMSITRRGVTKIIVPPSLRGTLLQRAHRDFNHPGISQMTRLIAAQYYWDGMTNDIRTHLYVPVPPMIWIPDQLVGAPVGSQVTLDCHTEAYPMSINYWTKEGGDMIISNDKYTASKADKTYKVHMRLTIQRVGPRDFGTYRCFAKNSLGSTEGTIRLYGNGSRHPTTFYFSLFAFYCPWVGADEGLSAIARNPCHFLNLAECMREQKMKEMLTAFFPDDDVRLDNEEHTLIRNHIPSFTNREIIFITEKEIKDLCSNLNIRKAPGPDNMRSPQSSNMLSYREALIGEKILDKCGIEYKLEETVQSKKRIRGSQSDDSRSPTRSERNLKTPRMDIDEQSPATGVSQQMNAAHPPQDDEENSDNDGPWTTVTNVKKPRIPPVIAENVADWKLLCQELKDLCMEPFQVTISGKKHIIKSKNIGDFKKIREYVQKNNGGYSYRLQEEKPLKVVLKGVSTAFKEEDVVIELISMGFTEVIVKRLHRQSTKIPMNIVLVELPKNEQNKRIYGITEILYQKIVVESFRTTKRVTQCFNCQGFGHGQLNCFLKPKCVKCAEEHHSKDCPRKSKQLPPKCANCGEAHTANYRGCPNFPKPQQQQLKPPRQNSPNTIPQASSTKTEEAIVEKQKASYAETAKKKTTHSDTRELCEKLLEIIKTFLQ